MFFLSFFSCSEKYLSTFQDNRETGLATKQSRSLENFHVQTKGEFLVFKDSSEFYEVVKALSKLSIKDKIAWANSKGIESILSIYEDVINSEVSFYNELKGDVSKLSDVQKKNLERYGYTTSKAFDNEDIIIYDKENGFDIKICDSFIAAVIGRKRLVKVGRAIHKYYENQIKVINDGDESKIAFLDNTVQSDKNITVFTIEKSYSSNGRVETATRSLSCEAGGPSYPAQFKIITYDEFEVVGITQGIDLQYYTIFNHKAKIRNLSRTWFGAWVNYTNHIQVSGNVYYYDNSYIALTNWSRGYLNLAYHHTLEEPLLYYAQIVSYKTPIYLNGQCNGANQHVPLGCRINY